jgi:Protein of unknown function (DUF3160)
MHRFRGGLLYLAYLAACDLILAGRVTAAEQSPFDEAERIIVSSPEGAADYPVPSGEKVVDLEASPGGGEVVVLLGSRSGSASRALIWKVGGTPSEIWRSPAGTTPKSITWHPEERVLFVLAGAGSEHQILRLEPGTPSWTSRVIHRSKAALRRLVVGPRPFVVEIQPEPKLKQARRYRLFFGQAAWSGQWEIRSVSELGEAEYQVVGPKKPETKPAKDGGDGGHPGEKNVTSALPLGFHPGGHLLLLEDGRHVFHAKVYLGEAWGDSKLLWGGALSGGTVTALPNGLGVLHWKPGTAGAEAVIRGGKERIPLAAGVTFTSTPSLMPDGKGIVGVTRSGAEGGEVLRFVPVTIPLADVVNAWMFAEAGDDLALLQGKGGLFRRVGGEQLYGFYDSEMYQCGGYSSTTSTRPYLVTTDILWEVWAAAYEGLFILREREIAIPAFWTFVDAAAAELSKAELSNAEPSKADASSPWASLFASARASRDGATRDEEAKRIRAHAGTAPSRALGEPFDYAELTPRGHYAGKPTAADYFAAMRYLTAAGARLKNAGPLARLSPAVRAKAAAWIGVYEPFIAPPRSPEALRASAPVRSWVREPLKEPALFPLSWAFDNEALNSTVFHPSWLAAEQVKGLSGPRLVPSGLDVVAAFGSQLARTLLRPEIAKYPRLEGALDRLAARRPRPGKGASLYERWLEALGVQWADEALRSTEEGTREVWGVKRLQTGLASWATLRHATVLVNERSAAECGEAGYEELVMRPPRGTVEADPKTFEAIASLFDGATELVESSPGMAGSVPKDDANGDQKREPLRQGLLKRLREAAAKARSFGAMAAKELRGEALTAKEYEEILYVARAAEHDFLVFKSLASSTLALSQPDPMPKVADVAGGGTVPLLLAAVGPPLEFDLVVPFFGRRQVVKGAVYAYHELTSRAPMTDEEWRKRAGSEPLVKWAEPFVARTLLTCPPKSPF